MLAESSGFVQRLFEMEVSEIGDGTMEIKGIAREAGYRSKVAVVSHDERVDPVGACVGMRGMRVKNMFANSLVKKLILCGERRYQNANRNALAPARLKHLDADEQTYECAVTVDADQLSLAIGKRGQNARLTSKLTGWRVDVQKDEESMDFEERVAVAVERLAKERYWRSLCREVGLFWFLDPGRGIGGRANRFRIY